MDYLKELWNDLKEFFKETKIIKNFDRRMSETHIIQNLEPLLIEYYKSKLIEIKLNKIK
jgi:hypothetical protein